MITSNQLIGQVAARYLSNQLEDEEQGVARFIVDCLSPEQTAAIVDAVLQDTQLAAKIDIKMPARFLAGMNLPSSVLTEERTTYFRNAACGKPALLVANTGDDEEQSLKDLFPLGSLQLQEQTGIWVQIASTGLPLNEAHLRHWERALRGLGDLHLVSLDRLASYVLRTRDLVDKEGLALIHALGRALPALRLPRDTYYFTGISEATLTHASRWKLFFTAAVKKRGCFLNKQTTSGLVLSEDDLNSAWKRVKDSIPDVEHGAVQAFIAAPSGWNSEAEALAECEWENVKPLFDGLRRERFNLGQATLNFFDDRDPQLLSEDRRDYLNRLISRRTTEAEDEDEEFYETHRNDIQDDRKLKSAWDRFIFGVPREAHDFIAGIALCLEPLFGQSTPSVRRSITIRCDSRSKKDFKDLNVDAGQYFTCRYKGLRTLFGSSITWEVGQLFNFSNLVEEWKSSQKPLNRSEAKLALQLKFVISLESELVSGSTEVYSTQMIWIFDPKRVASQLPEDWLRLSKHPLMFCTARRKALSGKGQFQTVDLSNVGTFEPAYDKNRGSFVAAYKRSDDLALVWQANLESARAQDMVLSSTANAIQDKFVNFQVTYATAVRGFLEDGLTSTEIFDQADLYADLLTAICSGAKGDRSRQLLLRPLLQIGVVAIEGGQPTCVVTPWHPLRMAAMAQKARHVAALVKTLLSPEQTDFSDSRLFFKDLKEVLDHPFYPELVLGWQETQPELLAVTDASEDYSLHENPVALLDGMDDTNENPTEGAKQVINLVQRYLALHPHEQTNLSVVLYNCDSARLPQAVVEKLGALQDDEEDMHCQVVLRHRNPRRLRALYEKIVEASDVDPDTFNASEATKDFMARLRISIMADQAPVPDSKDGSPINIAFSQDVIARHARVEWFETDAAPVDREVLFPSRWSRRRPAARDDMKSVVYLCCPVQSREGWSYLTALTTFFKGDWNGNQSRRLLPARQLNFQDPAMARIFEETHNLAEWVVNYDELLDRRQLLNQKVRVIKYKQCATQGRNIVISSKAPLGLLRSMTLERIKSLNLDIDEKAHQLLVGRFIDDAMEISGDIVLRAAKRGRSASELMGVVLSRFLIRHELGLDRVCGWYFLDDYADWLGQREEQIADVLVISPLLNNDGLLKLSLIVTESKYIEVTALAVKRRESAKQLRDTVTRISDAIFENPHRLDRGLWLDRLSDLVLDGIQFPASAGYDPAVWRRAIREGKCELSLQSYSHVFVSGPSDAPDCSELIRVSGTQNSFQQVFSRAEVRQLMMKYLRNEHPTTTREEAEGGDQPSSDNSSSKSSIKDTTSGVSSTSSETSLSSSYWPGGISRPSQDQAKNSTGVVSPILDNPERNATDKTPMRPPSLTNLPGSSDGTATETRAETEGPMESSSDDQSEAIPEVKIDNLWSSSDIGQLLVARDAVVTNAADDLAWLKQVESRMRGALQQLQFQAKIITSVLTPNSALFKFAGSASLTVEQVAKRRSEFLTTYGLNLVAIRPEPGMVALAVERPTRQTVALQELWRRWMPSSKNGNSELLIGLREDDGSLFFMAPGKRHAPHTLIAGTTGSGKSVLMQNILLAIAATNTPAQAKIVLIDPKQGVDYFAFEDLPHLEGGLIDDVDIAGEAVENLVFEMDRRYRLFRQVRAQNLEVYNEKVSASERLPFVWLIHDEFAEWMLIDDYKQRVSSAVGRLGVKARAAGIHLVFAAQRPDVNVMPLQLRANLGNRLILRVDSEGTSEIALGEKGAERLLGRGHLMAKLEGEVGITYAQIPYVAPEFMEKMIDVIRHGNSNG